MRDNNLGDVHTGIICFIDVALNQAKFNQKSALERYENWINTIVNIPMKSPINNAVDDTGMAIKMDALDFNAGYLMTDSRTSIGFYLSRATYHNHYSEIIVHPQYRNGFDVTILKKAPVLLISRNFNSELAMQNEFMITEDGIGVYQTCASKELLDVLTRLLFTFLEQVKGKSENTKTINEAVLASQAIKRLIDEKPVNNSIATITRKQNILDFIKTIVTSELNGKVTGHSNARRLSFADNENDMPVASFTVETYQKTYLIRESYTNQIFDLSNINSNVADGKNLKALDTFVTDIVKDYQTNTDRQATIINTINTLIDDTAGEKTKTNIQISTGQAELFRRALYLKRYDLKISNVEITDNSLIVECINNAEFKLEFSLSSGSQRPLSVMVLTSADELIRKSRLNSFDGLLRLIKDIVKEAIDIQNKENAINDTLTARGNTIKIGSLRNKHQVVTMTIPEVTSFMKKENLTLDAIVINTTDNIVDKASAFHEAWSNPAEITSSHDTELDE